MIDRDQLKAHLDFFGELGVTGVSKNEEWRSRVSPESGVRSPEFPSSSAADANAEPRTPDTGLDSIRTDIGPDCQRCKLCTQGRKQVVFGVGNPHADVMFVGEAPGADEDQQGEPFVGRAGQLLTKIIEAMKFSRSDVYIANVIKCRPPNNRPPEPDEIATCEPFLFRQIDVIQPKVIVALGKHAAHALLKVETPISKLRGQVFDYRGGAKLMPTFHPSYLLRTPSAKREVWEDMKHVRQLLGLPPVE